MGGKGLDTFTSSCWLASESAWQTVILAADKLYKQSVLGKKTPPGRVN